MWDTSLTQTPCCCIGCLVLRVLKFHTIIFYSYMAFRTPELRSFEFFHWCLGFFPLFWGSLTELTVDDDFLCCCCFTRAIWCKSQSILWVLIVNFVISELFCSLPSGFLLVYCQSSCWALFALLLGGKWRSDCSFDLALLCQDGVNS